MRSSVYTGSRWMFMWNTARMIGIFSGIGEACKVAGIDQNGSCSDVRYSWNAHGQFGIRSQFLIFFQQFLDFLVRPFKLLGEFVYGLLESVWKVFHGTWEIYQGLAWFLQCIVRLQPISEFLNAFCLRIIRFYLVLVSECIFCNHAGIYLVGLLSASGYFGRLYRVDE